MLAMALSSLDGDGATDAMLVVARYRCRVMLVTMIVLPSLAGDGVVESF
jgi:hypothetical protein